MRAGDGALLTGDLTHAPLVPVDGALPVVGTSRPTPSWSTPRGPTTRPTSRWLERLSACQRLLDGRVPHERVGVDWLSPSSRHWCTAACARSSSRPARATRPLAMALAQADGAGMLRLHTRIDERSAGFLALGLDEGSGTGRGRRHHVGHRGGQPAPGGARGCARRRAGVAVTADRPARLRGTGANQTTDQVGVFGPQIATSDVAAAGDGEVARVALAADWHRPGPPCSTSSSTSRCCPRRCRSTCSGRQQPVDDPPTPARVGAPSERARPRHRARCVVAGDDAGPAARRLAEHAGWPLLAEPTSGARTGANAIRTYRLLLDGRSPSRSSASSSTGTRRCRVRSRG